MSGSNGNKVHKSLLKVLHSAKPTLRKAILDTADRALVYSICEICHNTLNGNAPLTRPQVQKLKKHRRVLERLSAKGESWQKKKSVLKQTGGAFLPLLLSILAPTIGSALFGS